MSARSRPSPSPSKPSQGRAGRLSKNGAGDDAVCTVAVERRAFGKALRHRDLGRASPGGRGGPFQSAARSRRFGRCLRSAVGNRVPARAGESLRFGRARLPHARHRIPSGAFARSARRRGAAVRPRVSGDVAVACELAAWLAAMAILALRTGCVPTMRPAGRPCLLRPPRPKPRCRPCAVTRRF
jgi:hypothetical protein